jgi:hypothetical protein
MPTQNLRAVSGASALSEALNSQSSPLILAICYDNTNKALSARDVANNLTIPILGNASDLQIAADGHVGLANDLILRKTVTVTSAQIKTLNTVPTTILAAPGAGFGYVLNSAIFNLVFGTTQYASGGVVSITFTGQATNLLATTLAANQITSATSTRNWIPGAAGQNAIVINTGLDIKAATGDFTTGDSILNVTLEYKIVSLL